MSESSINRALIHRKLERLQQYLDELRPVSKCDLETYRKDLKTRRQAERSVELAIMTACDINTHIVAKLTGRPPEDYYQPFLDLAKLKVYPADFAQRIAPAAGLRNRLQHEYNQIDDDQVFRSIDQALDDFAEYAGYVLAFISSQD